MRDWIISESRIERESLALDFDASGKIAELQAAVDAHCPVLDLFANPTRVRTALTVG